MCKPRMYFSPIYTQILVLSSVIFSTSYFILHQYLEQLSHPLYRLLIETLQLLQCSLSIQYLHPPTYRQPTVACSLCPPITLRPPDLGLTDHGLLDGLRMCALKISRPRSIRPHAHFATHGLTDPGRGIGGNVDLNDTLKIF